MKPYEWMVTYTSQTEWIEKRGILLWLAFFFIELGAGTFLVSSLFDSLWGMIIGWLVCALLGGGTHLLYLGHPLRFWRIFVSSGWKTSWISRGMYFVTLFLLLGLIHMGLVWQASSAPALLIITNVLAFLVVIYGGFAMNFVNGIPLWNTAILPVLYVVSGLWGGAGLTVVTAMATNAADVGMAAEAWARLLLMGFVLLLTVYLISVRYGSLAGETSVREMVRGKWAPLLWVVVVALGIVFPLGVLINSLALGPEAVPTTLLAIAIFFELTGDLAMRYLILKCGFYSPLVPVHL
jgi:formate-dependent nitrite reductase membrane component NrfD